MWLVILYLGVSWLNAELMHEMTHADDVPLHFSLLVVTAILGTTKWGHPEDFRSCAKEVLP